MTPRGRETAPGARDGAGRGIAYLTPAEAALRSTAIVAVLEATGGNLLAAKEMARHENIATTIGRYAQDAAEARVAAAAWIDAALEGDAEDEPEDDDDLRVRLTDIPIAIWEDLTDAAA